MSHAHTISDLKAREILDSRGNPTIEVKVYLKSGVIAKAAVPSGASTGRHEAHELRDKDPKRYGGLGVLQACANVDKILGAVRGMEVTHQEQIDREMIELDGSSNLRNLGANAILGVSLACARAAAVAHGLPLYEYIRGLYKTSAPHRKRRGTEDITNGHYQLPVPLFNIFNGGRHADTNLDFQEFMIIPGGIKESFAEQVRVGAEIFHQLKKVLHKYNLDTDVGSEGGYAPNIDNSMQALDMIVEAIGEAGFQAGSDVQLGMDVGASVLFDQKSGVYHFGLLDHDMTADQLISLYSDWVREYPFVLIEDGVHEDDWAAWQTMTEELRQLSEEFVARDRGRDFLVVGDDLFVTQTGRLEAGIGQQVANSVIVKPNQVGTLSQTLEFVRLAQGNHYQVVASHRSGETIDDFIADFAVGVGAGFIKAGSLARGERTAKYNRLMEIEAELNQES